MKVKRRSKILIENHREMLRKSGLTDETVEKNGIFSISESELRKKLNNSKVKGGGCFFPIITRKGVSIADFNVRLDEPYQNRKGKESKYMRPKGAPIKLYIPFDTWKVLDNEEIPLFYTEGEKKALKATQEGFYTIGIPGVWGWSKNHKMKPDFRGIKHKGRVAYIVFDADKSTNENVRMAERRLAEELKKRGAEVRIVNLPDSYKLDDYLVRKGKQAFQGLIAKAQGTKEYLENTPPRSKEEILDILKESSASMRIHPAQDYAGGRMNFAVQINGKKYVLFSDGECHFFDSLAGKGTDLTTRDVDVFRFSNSGISEFLEGRSSPSIAKTFLEIRAYLERYVIFPPGGAYSTLVAIWAINTYMFKVFRYYPYLWLNAEKRSGKSLLLEILAPIIFNGEISTSLSMAVMFRDISANLTSMLMDEVESLTSKNKEERGEFMGLLNGGFNKAGSSRRVEPTKDGYKPKRFSTFSPKILAGINDLDDVLKDRTIPIKLLRKKDNEKVERYKETPELLSLQSAIRDKMYQIALVNGPRLAEKYHKNEEIESLSHLRNREKDIWEPLILLAQMIEEESPEVGIINEMVELSRRISEHKNQEDMSSNETYKLLDIVKQMMEDIKPFCENDREIMYKTDVALEYFQGTEEYAWLTATNALTSRLKRIGVSSVQKRFKKNKKVRVYVINKQDINDRDERYKA